MLYKDQLVILHLVTNLIRNVSEGGVTTMFVCTVSVFASCTECNGGKLFLKEHS